MATILNRGNQVACVSGNNIAVFTIGSEEKAVYKCEQPVVPETGSVAKQPGKQDSQDGGASDKGTDVIVASTFSPSGNYFAACDDHKQLIVWKTGQEWTKLNTRALARRVTSLCFTSSEDTLLVANKSGDVCRYSIGGAEEDGKILLSHVSLLLDIALTDDNRFVVTADRDEKIRVSHYPNSYNIQSFCLGHTDFVSRLLCLPEEALLVSGSGDGSVRIWNYKSGKQLYRVDCKPALGIVSSPDDKDAGGVEESRGGGDSDRQEEQGEVEEEAEGENVSDSGQGDSDSGEEGDGAATNGDGEKQKQDGCQAARNTTDLQCLAFDKKNKLLAVAFDKLATIFIYQLEISDSGPRLKFLQKVEADGPVWDVTFDDLGHMLVLQPIEGKTVLAYNLVQQSGKTEFVPLEDTTDKDRLLKTVEVINKDWEFFKGSVGRESIVSSIHKNTVDNMKSYLDKKQQRIEELSQKRKNRDRKKKKVPTATLR